MDTVKDHIKMDTVTDHIKSKKHLTNKEAKRKCDGAGTASSSSKQPCLLVCILRQHTPSVHSNTTPTLTSVLYVSACSKYHVKLYLLLYKLCITTF